MSNIRAFSLTRSEREDLEEILKGRRTEKVLVVKRAQSLLALALGKKPRDVSASYGLHRRTVENLRTRFSKSGLPSLYDKKAPGKQRIFGAREEALIVALACSAPPDGHARWSASLLAIEARDRGLVKSIGRESIRIILNRHELKPWREKNVVRSRAGRRVSTQDGRRP